MDNEPQPAIPEARHFVAALDWFDEPVRDNVQLAYFLANFERDLRGGGEGVPRRDALVEALEPTDNGALLTIRVTVRENLPELNSRQSHTEMHLRAGPNANAITIWGAIVQAIAEENAKFLNCPAHTFAALPDQESVR